LCTKIIINNNNNNKNSNNNVDLLNHILLQTHAAACALQSKFSFANKIASIWNCLPDYVVYACHIGILKTVRFF